MQLYLFSDRPFEETFGNPQWRKVKQMQPMWLCLYSGRQFEDTFKNTQWRKVIQMKERSRSSSWIFSTAFFREFSWLCGVAHFEVIELWHFPKTEISNCWRLFVPIIWSVQCFIAKALIIWIESHFNCELLCHPVHWRCFQLHWCSKLPIIISSHFYRTEVNMGSELWVRMSVTEWGRLCWLNWCDSG